MPFTPLNAGASAGGTSSSFKPLGTPTASAPAAKPTNTISPGSQFGSNPIDWSKPNSIPGSTTGRAIGTIAGSGIAKIRDLINGTNESKYYDNSRPSLGQVAGDATNAAAIIGGLAAAPATIPGAIGVGILSGAAQAGGSTAAKGGSLGATAKSAAIGGAVGGVTAGAISGFGKLLGGLGDKITTAEIKPSQADVKDGFSLDTIKQHDLGGTLSQMQRKTQAALKGLTEQLHETLGAHGNTPIINLDDVLGATEAEIKSSKGSLSNFGMNTKVGGALEQLKSEIAALGRPDVSIPDAQVVKQAAGGFGAWSYGKPDPESKASEVIYNAFYRNLKAAIEKSSPEGVREINGQIAKLIPVQNAILRRIPVASRNNPISLTDFIGLATSTISPSALGLTLVNALSKSGAVGNLLSKYASSIGQRAAGPIGGALGAGASSLSQHKKAPGI